MKNTTKDTQRLDKLLANSGFGTRKGVKDVLKLGTVQVDGKIVKDGSIHVNPQKSEIKVNDEKLNYRKYIYLMMNKPAGVISATHDGKHRTVIDIMPEEYKHFEPFPVGRLDIDTEGLLIITNDGELTHELLSPKKHVPKTYFARVQGRVNEEDIMTFKEGVVLDDGYLTMPAQLDILIEGDISEINLTIKEGKFHQVKRMFEAVGKKVIYLKRIKMGSLHLDEELELGGCKEINRDEVL
jgi:16S rRNA pseudouridine516 synthase